MPASPLPAGDAVTVTELNQQTTSVLRRVKEGQVLPITERGKVIAFLTPPPPTVTGNPTIDRWIAEGRLVPQAVPGTVLDLLPLAESTGTSLADAVIAERDIER
ncbi:type II toxin-antitoxin system prevent-host-death family antitoxin [Phytohabitans sp. ZYX-F-186]|uniref:Type II toxin-antitoxin system prevent-host-death family antitoxin n=1 Tax=Phytohabitans maris TaxID=3071409 RepID=A0ABU0ZHV5_9ACTN|nr:type II toxin-antitoxin system prevent-host-death family antitoxin [Phytohabitans sp. ZYX-F-186]MDQ7906633.1 type II toxin-antitoxin system prevent-host-death family antitoxin [Phytohabitans sp. ZYX-F-186]